MVESETSPAEDFRIDIGRAAKGTFLRVVHLPSGKERAIVGLKGELPQDVEKRFRMEILQELEKEKVQKENSDGQDS